MGLITKTLSAFAKRGVRKTGRALSASRRNLAKARSSRAGRYVKGVGTDAAKTVGAVGAIAGGAYGIAVAKSAYNERSLKVGYHKTNAKIKITGAYLALRKGKLNLAKRLTKSAIDSWDEALTKKYLGWQPGR